VRAAWPPHSVRRTIDQEVLIMAKGNNARKKETKKPKKDKTK
jgi:hypothetical protein